MPAATLRDRNDEVLEHIYSDTPKESLRDRRFTCNFSRGDTERLEKLFDLYTKMTSQHPRKKPPNVTGKVA